MPIVDVTSLLGRRFMTSSGNVATVTEILGPGGLKSKWRREPTKEDIEEFPKLLGNALGYELDAVDFDENTLGVEARKKTYQKFLDDENS